MGPWFCWRTFRKAEKFIYAEHAVCSSYSSPTSHFTTACLKPSPLFLKNTAKLLLNPYTPSSVILELLLWQRVHTIKYILISPTMQNARQSLKMKCCPMKLNLFYFIGIVESFLRPLHHRNRNISMLWHCHESTSTATSIP